MWMRPLTSTVSATGRAGAASGVIAVAAVIFHILTTLAVMALFGATLTLPGIAAIALTLGMAIDANVLINERIREELRAGASPQAAINMGYERAFATILDSNVTGLIAAIVLSATCFASLIGMPARIAFTKCLCSSMYGFESSPCQV